MNEQTIEVNDIEEPLFNSRLNADKKALQALADEIARDGLQSPIKVTRNESATGKTYRLVYGSRRLAAHKLADLPTIRAYVDDITPVEQLFQNAIENAQREDLSTFEKARLCAELRDRKLTVSEAVERLGWSKQYISNLTVTYTQIAPEVRAHWEASGLPENANDMALQAAAASNFLRELVKEKPAKQVEMFQARLAELRAFYSDGKKRAGKGKSNKGSSAKETTYKVTAERYGNLMSALKKVGNASAKELAMLAVKYVVGDIKKIKGVIEEPTKPNEEDE